MLLPGRYLSHRPQEALEVIARISSGNTGPCLDKDVVVVTCCDPRVADVIEKLEGSSFLRTPGCEVDPSWDTIGAVVADKKTIVFLCHDDCKAHSGSLHEAQRQVQWSRHAFWNHHRGADTTFLSGKVCSESRHLSFLKDDGTTWNAGQLLANVPRRSREAVERLLSMNDRRHPQRSGRNTTILHPPIGTLAISVDGVLSDFRARNAAYVVDHIGQSSHVFARQVSMIGAIAAENAKNTDERPHILVVGEAGRIDGACKIFEQATTSLARLENGHCFTAELAVRSRTGQFEQISVHGEICTKRPD